MKSTKQGETGGKRKPTPITPAQALDMLQSALRYCQQSGLSVECKSDDALAGLVIYLPTAKAETTPAGLRFALAGES
ncbi:MAG: hypothetical protein HYZ49_08545 [Chloroflexi bacterium]|nr:hypothetical protein [Chloroflexota bacterium]